MVQSNLPTKKVLAFTLLAMTLMSSSAFANVYKWRDSTGRTQYSDTPPATSYSIVKRSELINALQSKDLCTVPSSKPNLNAQSKLPKLSANFDFTVLGGSPGPSLGSSPGLSLGSSPGLSLGSSLGLSLGGSPSRSVPTIPKIPATIASITKFVSSHAMPAVISPAAASPVVKPVSKPEVSPTSTPVAIIPAPTTVAINLPPNIVQTALMPAVDISKNMAPAIGFSVLRLQSTTEKPSAPADGAFRIPCSVSHMSNDDPIVYPNQPGASHSHTFFGNTSTNSKSDLMNLIATGNSTCNGGIMNKSAYWVPSMIDTVTHAPIAPDGALIYYKSGDIGYIGPEPIVAPPTGLRMIAGNSKATPADAATIPGHFTCKTPTGTTPWSKTIPNCNVGDVLTMEINYPQCWDGINLDSPDHKAHMADRIYLSNTSIVQTCPADHPIKIPAIAINVNYTITKANQAANWRLASDNYASTTAGGYSAHADYVVGWDKTLLPSIVKNCITSRLDCHAHLTGDGRQMY